MYKILLFYCYTDIKNPSECKDHQYSWCSELNLTGRILIATEGINATVCGTEEATNEYIRRMKSLREFSCIDFKESYAPEPVFDRLAVLVKPEVVVLGKDPREVSASEAASYITPQELHELLERDPESVVLLDARNDYESAIGAFRNAVCPPIRTFRQLPAYLDANKALFHDKDVVMYCTGGIRCERASVIMERLRSARSVRHLLGGIHRYVELYPDGHFRGRNYVFDNRISVKVNDDLLGSCTWCAQPSALYTNCRLASCNKHYISCTSCTNTSASCCSPACMNLVSENPDLQRPPLFTQQEL